ESRLVPFSDLELAAGQNADSPESSWFDTQGRWCEPPASWSSADPQALVLRQEVHRALEAAIHALPAGPRAVVMLRDIEGLPAEEACNILEISETNQRVLLHRGRTRVRRALAALLERR
ncbi:MAG: RNA polymerase sigma factor, partial [Luteitalea sp.]|nr:RNA polymerase sigma factor [Luteitalea sp.]